MTDVVYVRRADAPGWDERPESARRDAGEWWWVEDDSARVLAPDEVGRKCSQKGCANDAVGVLWRTVHTRNGRKPRRWFCCADDFYGRIVDDGRVLRLRLRLEEDA